MKCAVLRGRGVVERTVIYILAGLALVKISSFAV